MTYVHLWWNLKFYGCPVITGIAATKDAREALGQGGSKSVEGDGNL